MSALLSSLKRWRKRFRQVLSITNQLEVPQLFGQPIATLVLVLAGMVLAGIAAYLSTKFLMKYFETGRLDPFAYYCWGAGLVSLVLLLTVLHIS